MPGRDRDISPRDAVERWLDKRRLDLADETVSSYWYRLKHFVEFCEDRGVTDMTAVDGWLVDEYEAHRRSRDPSPITHRNELMTFRDFLRWCEAIGLISDGVADVIEPPDVPRHEHVRDSRLDTDTAEALIAYYRDGPLAGSKFHVVVETLWVVGCRLGGLRALDLRDVDLEAGVLMLRHRPDTGTPLKRGRDGERDAGIPDATVAMLEQYIDEYRHGVADDHGRSPLLTSQHGRPAPTTIREWCYYGTVPCRIRDCPHDKEQSSCEWYSTTAAHGCPSSRSPHELRSGTITRMRNRGVDADVVATRVNATTRTIEQHYDLPDERERQQHREQPWIDDFDINSDDEGNP